MEDLRLLRTDLALDFTPQTVGSDCGVKKVTDARVHVYRKPIELLGGQLLEEMPRIAGEDSIPPWTVVVGTVSFTEVAGLGNAVDIDEADVLEYLADDDRTGTVFAYLEDLKHPKRFLDIASEMTRKKPLIVLKGGATAEGAKAAQSHTASLGADDRVLDGAFRQAGIVRINEFSQLFTVAKAAAFMPPPKGNRVGFVSPSGAFIVHTRDLCRQRLNLEFPEFQPATLARLKEISPPFIRLSNPVDIFPSATVHGMEFAYRESMEAVLNDPNVDAVVSIMILTKELGMPSLDFIPELAAKYPKKPLYISFSGDHACNEEAKAFLEPRGVPTFPLIEDAFKALDILVRAGQALKS